MRRKNLMAVLLCTFTLSAASFAPMSAAAEETEAVTEAVTEAANSRLETQKNSFEGYGAEQTALLNAAVLEVRGNYVLYVVHPDAPAAQQAFLDSL